MCSLASGDAHRCLDICEQAHVSPTTVQSAVTAIDTAGHGSRAAVPCASSDEFERTLPIHRTKLSIEKTVAKEPAAKERRKNGKTEREKTKERNKGKGNDLHRRWRPTKRVIKLIELSPQASGWSGCAAGVRMSWIRGAAIHSPRPCSRRFRRVRLHPRPQPLTGAISRQLLRR